MSEIPLSLYIHIPWCIKKCPYCDFNSHAVQSNLDESAYLAALLADLDQDCEQFGTRPLESIFIGGGTPSLFSPDVIADLLRGVEQRLPFRNDIEITLEANPGTFEQARFQGFRAAGVNRLSVGIQSFQQDKLIALGRVHSADDAKKVAASIRSAGFDNFNLDLMHGLPNQTVDDALADLRTAIDCAPPHLSWYQLTIEPNTVFYKTPPSLPNSDALWDIETAGKALLAEHAYMQYEVSAYAREQQYARHNLNYWQFGDYLGIGAGAHGKMTQAGQVIRTQKKRQPKDYLNPDKAFMAEQKSIGQQDVIFEFMLNALRCYQAISVELFEQRTGLSIETIADKLQQAVDKGLLEFDGSYFETTELGKRYLNDLVSSFM